MEWLPRLLLLLLLVDVRGEMLRMEVTVDGGIEALEFDRCASEFELIGLAHTFVHRSGSTLSAVAMPGGVVKSHSELVVDEMRRLQAEATYYSRDACPPRSAPADELPPIWNWGDLRNVARRSDGPRVLLNFGGGIANDMHAFDERYAGWVAVEGPSDPDGYSYGFCADRGQKRGPSYVPST